MRRFRFDYTPWKPDSKIKTVILIIHAESLEEAEAINIENNYKFFDLDCSITVSELFNNDNIA